MVHYKLLVFNTVTNRMSFSKAAEELHITQPAVTRHIKQLEEHFKQKLFERKGNSIALTQAGAVLFEHTKKILEQHKALEFDMNALIDRTQGVLSIAASTTMAQYILPEALSRFHQKFPKVQLTLINANTQYVEKKVLDSTVELGFIEGHSKNREISYHPFMKDEIVLVAAKGHALYNKGAIAIKDLYNFPLVLREEGSGSLEIIKQALKETQAPVEKLNVVIRLGSSESMKTYIQDQRSVAFLSINTILKELKATELGIIDIEELSINRYFSYIFKQGHQSPLATLFLNFLKHHYNILL
ncbi:LysR substrate-binding domain-containing protein [Marixanthomonas ophiurae]|uniref:LysR family transcriptional regulator n=1 Tax=Marixanthomonas ophiurae TaxID=387659 RepID=A0A3E1Q7T2_9FLAO|nr:LysR substrate-binding domain-containing protein [Marixanthomonas ophiurae]RFN58178.1 LysR family transcriptional regulator [Marixanthomonas ophiurae]